MGPPVFTIATHWDRKSTVNAQSYTPCSIVGDRLFPSSQQLGTSQNPNACQSIDSQNTKKAKHMFCELVLVPMLCFAFFVLIFNPTGSSNALIVTSSNRKLMQCSCPCTPWPALKTSRRFGVRKAAWWNPGDCIVHKANNAIPKTLPSSFWKESLKENVRFYP